MPQILNILFLLSMAIWVGALFFFSFFTAPTVFRELPKEIAGELIGKLFPPYYFLGYITIGLSFFSLLFKGILEKPLPWVRLLILLMMLGCTLYAGVNNRPKTHLLKTVIRTMEDSPEKEAKQAEFTRLHKQSVYLNLAVLIGGVLVLGITASKLP